MHFKGMRLLDPLFVIMENWINLICRRIFLFFSSVNKGTCISCYYQYFAHKVLILQCPWKEKTGCKYKAESSIITCLETNISFSQMTSSFYSSVNMLFSYILIEKKEEKCYFGVNNRYFSTKYCQKSQNLGFLIF